MKYFHFLNVDRIGEQNPFGFIHSIIVIAILAVISLGIGLIMIGILKVIPELENWKYAISYIVSFWLTLIIIKLWLKITLFEFIKVNIVVYLLIIPLTISLSIIMESIVNLFPVSERLLKMLAEIEFNYQNFIMLAIAAPIFEELIFRGVILKSLLKRYNPFIAIGASSILFGFVHFNLPQFIAAFAIGLVIGWIYWKTKSIWPCIFMHFVNNSLSFYLAKKYESININFQDIIGNTLYYISLLLICMLIIYAIYMILDNYFRNLESKHNEKFSV